jgi:hypothetical protein
MIFLEGLDLKKHKKSELFYKVSLGSMILSFPMSFYYSRLAVIDKARAS